MSSRESTSFGSFDHWHQVICRSYSTTECRHQLASTFQLDMATRTLGNVALGEVSTSSFASVSLQRGADEVRKDQVDNVMAMHVVAGDVAFSQGDRSLRVRTGDLFIYDQSRPWRSEVHGGHQLAIMVIPRTAMMERLAKAKHFSARVLNRQAGVGDLARSTLHHLLHLGALSPSSAELLGSAAVDILAAALDPASSEVELPNRQIMLKAAQAYVLDHLSDRELDIERIAVGIGVAPRTLNRVFAYQGVTPMRWLWQQRLAVAHTRLCRRNFGTITEVALDCGFVDLAHFSRRFKKTYGINASLFATR